MRATRAVVAAAKAIPTQTTPTAMTTMKTRRVVTTSRTLIRAGKKRPPRFSKWLLLARNES